MNMNAAKKPKTNALQFNPESGVKASLTMPDGKVVNYTAYNKLYFVTNVEDSTYQPELGLSIIPLFRLV